MATSGLSTSAAPSFIHSGNSSSRFRPCAQLSHRSSFFGAELDHRDVLLGALRLPRGKSRRELRFLVSAHLGQPEHIDSALNFLAQAPDNVQNVLARAEGWLYTIADAAVATDAATEGAQETVKQAQQGDWFSGVTRVMEVTLTLLKDGLSTVGVPYAYGFAIILLTVIVKLVTFPLTKKQMESSLAMQNLQPKLKAIQERYKGNQDRIQIETARLYKQAGINPLAGCLPVLITMPVWIGLYRALSNVANEGLLTEGFFWIPSLAGPTTVAARQTGSGTAWLFPFVDGQPPLGWHDTIAYLVLPVLLIISQAVAMEFQKTPQTDQQGAQQVILKFLPLMIGYFALSVPSGLSLYWLTNNVLSSGQQILLKKLNEAKPIVGPDGGDIITAGLAKRSSASTSTEVVDSQTEKEIRRGERFRRLKEAEAKRKAERAERAPRSKEGTTDEADETDTESDTEDGTTMFDEEGDEANPEFLKDSLEGLYASSPNGAASDGSPNKRKRSKRKRSV